MPANSLRDAALGCMLGAHVGDAAGAVLEFKPRSSIDNDKVEHALAMPGGGVWGVGPGQITDDSELALCLADGLLASGSHPRCGFPDEAVARRYKAWVHSRPFDIGNTCRTAFGASMQQCASVAERMRGAAKASWASQANGQLMRCTPLAVWGHALCDGELAAACRADAELSHPNLVCQDASAAYCIALKHLINHPGDAHGAAGAADDWAQRSACPDVRYWLYESKAVLTGPPCDRNIGYVRWGFTHAFRALRLKLSFREGLREVLLLGGDTDTNAAIVGGMLGALHGESGIPSSMSGPVLARTCSQGIARPDWLCSSRVPKLVDQLLALSVPGPPASSTTSTSTSVSGRGRESLSSSSGLRDDEMPETRARRGNMFAGGQGLGFGVQCPS